MNLKIKIVYNQDSVMSFHQTLPCKNTPTIVKRHSDSEIKYRLCDFPTIAKHHSFSLSLCHNMYNNVTYISDEMVATNQCKWCQNIFLDHT